MKNGKIYKKDNLFLHFEVENYFDELEIDENYLKKILK